MKPATDLETLGQALVALEIANRIWADHSSNKPALREGRAHHRANLRAKAEHHLQGRRLWAEVLRAEANVKALTCEIEEAES